MARFRHHVERRLFDAVLLALAAAGCRAPSGAQGPDPARTDDLDAGVETSHSHDSTESAHPGLHADANVTPPPDAQALCTERATVAPDPKKIKRAPTRVSGDRAERVEGNPPLSTPEVYGSWDPWRQVVSCTIVREVVYGPVEMMHTPACCQNGPRPVKCAEPSKVVVEGTKKLVEEAELRADGAVVTSKLSWQISSPNAPRPYNCGRRPQGWSPAGTECEHSASDVACVLAEMAELEAASIPAFERLARELEAHGAPRALVRRARTAMHDEVRHAEAVRSLAVAYGARPREVSLPSLAVRALVDFALENAVEGCVRESYGALVSTYQGEAGPPELRAIFAAIARDERQHAALASDVDTWVREKLSDADRRALDVARQRAVRELREVLEVSEEVRALGIPGGTQAVALFDSYFMERATSVAAPA